MSGEREALISVVNRMVESLSPSAQLFMQVRGSALAAHSRQRHSRARAGPARSPLPGLTSLGLSPAFLLLRPGVASILHVPRVNRALFPDHQQRSSPDISCRARINVWVQGLLSLGVCYQSLGWGAWGCGVELSAHLLCMGVWVWSRPGDTVVQGGCLLHVAPGRRVLPGREALRFRPSP